MTNCGRRSAGTESVMKTQAAGCPHAAECRYEYTQKKSFCKKKIRIFNFFYIFSSYCNFLILAPSLTAAVCHTRKCDTTRMAQEYVRGK